MNDFTLDELIEIQACVEADYQTSINLGLTESASISRIIIKKLEILIDNYCEHTLKNDWILSCVRCKSPQLDKTFEIKYGLHNWDLCKECSSRFREWVFDKTADDGCLWAKEYFNRKYGKK